MDPAPSEKIESPSHVADEFAYEKLKIIWDADVTVPEICRLRDWPENKLKVFLFMRKNKKDKGGNIAVINIHRFPSEMRLPGAL